MINCSPSARERRLSLWVDNRSQGGRCFNAGTSVARDSRLANSVHPLFFQFRQCGTCLLARADWPNALRPARQGGGRWKTSKATVARGDRKQRLRAENARGEETRITTVTRGDCARRGGADHFACWLIYHVARTRLRRDCTRTSAKTRPSGCIFCARRCVA